MGRGEGSSTESAAAAGLRNAPAESEELRALRARCERAINTSRDGQAKESIVARRRRHKWEKDGLVESTPIENLYPPPEDPFEMIQWYHWAWRGFRGDRSRVTYFERLPVHKRRETLHKVLDAWMQIPAEPLPDREKDPFAYYGRVFDEQAEQRMKRNAEHILHVWADKLEGGADELYARLAEFYASAGEDERREAVELAEKMCKVAAPSQTSETSRLWGQGLAMSSFNADQIWRDHTRDKAVREQIPAVRARLAGKLPEGVDEPALVSHILERRGRSWRAHAGFFSERDAVEQMLQMGGNADLDALNDALLSEINAEARDKSVDKIVEAVKEARQNPRELSPKQAREALTGVLTGHKRAALRWDELRASYQAYYAELDEDRRQVPEALRTAGDSSKLDFIARITGTSKDHVAELIERASS